MRVKTIFLLRTCRLSKEEDFFEKLKNINFLKVKLALEKSYP
jgi:hypothetical protein